MIVSDLRAERTADGLVARSARLGWVDGDPSTITVTVPERYAPVDADDASGPLGLALLLAMRTGEDVDIEGRVDSELLTRLPEIRDLYSEFDPTMRPARVEVAGTLDPVASSPAGSRSSSGVFLSRGVDSMYAAALGRSTGSQIGHAVFADGLEPNHGSATRRGELALVRVAAARLDLPLVEVRVEGMRPLVDTLLDWEDAVGAGLAWIAHALSGGLGRMVIPSSDSVHTIGPCGTSPLLDPLFSSSRMAVEHADVRLTRLGKVAWLFAQRPDLLDLVKVCFALDGTGNCGSCGKCLHTMACLRVTGATALATGFPPDLDLDLIAAQRPGPLQARFELAEIGRAARERGDDELAAAIATSLAATAAVRPSPSHAPTFRMRHTLALLDLLDANSDQPASIGHSTS